MGIPIKSVTATEIKFFLFKVGQYLRSNFLEPQKNNPEIKTRIKMINGLIEEIVTQNFSKK